MAGSWAPCLPYAWGTFQSWLFLVVGPILVLGSSVVMVAPGVAQETRYASVGYLVEGLLQFPTGLGLLRKRRFGLILVYLLLGLKRAGGTRRLGGSPAREGDSDLGHVAPLLLLLLQAAPRIPLARRPLEQMSWSPAAYALR